MKLLTRRAWGVLILSSLILFGVLVFIGKYIGESSRWALQPNNRHLYENGQLIVSGKIYDRNGEILYQRVEGKGKFHEKEAVRKAMMHAVGDDGSNVVTAARIVFRDQLSGWNLLNGTYRFSQEEGKSGNDLYLSFDAALSATATQALAGRKGTVGVYNYQTGEILCVVSNPTFDPKSPPNIEKSPDRYEGVYLNRLFSASYTPGSVFKLITTAAAIEQLEGWENMTFHCQGETIIEGEKVTCLKKHGDVTLEQALAESCNIAFAELILALGGETLQKYAEKAGFNQRLTFDGISAAMGKVEAQDATGGNLAWAGIGQSTDTANPLTMMTYVGAIANEGQRVTPTIKQKNRGLGKLRPNWTSGRQQVLPKTTADQLKQMMRNNVLQNYGEKNYQGLELCAKSGTAEVGGGLQPHAWFVGFLDREDYPLAFVVVVENGGGGSKVAGSVAAKVLKAAVAEK